MAVRTKQFQILGPIIEPVAVLVIDVEGKRSS
jgi:hypothetical protein